MRENCVQAMKVRQLIDDFVLTFAQHGQNEPLEHYLIDGYEYILNVRGYLLISS